LFVGQSVHNHLQILVVFGVLLLDVADAGLDSMNLVESLPHVYKFTVDSLMKFILFEQKFAVIQRLIVLHF
jgi:hypothetical protein